MWEIQLSLPFPVPSYLLTRFLPPPSSHSHLLFLQLNRDSSRIAWTDQPHAFPVFSKSWQVVTAFFAVCVGALAFASHVSHHHHEILWYFFYWCISYNKCQYLPLVQIPNLGVFFHTCNLKEGITSPVL